MNNYTTHRDAAKMIRAWGINATCKKAKDGKYDVHVSGLTNGQLNEVTDMVWTIYDDKTINVIPA